MQYREVMDQFPNYIRHQADLGVPAAQQILAEYKAWLQEREEYCPVHGWECSCKKNLREEN